MLTWLIACENIINNLQILYKAHKNPVLHILEQFEIYKHQTTHKNEILNYHISYNNIIL